MTAPAALGRRRRRGGAFRVPQLFANGEAGAWYDPSDLTAEKVAWALANPGFTSAQSLAAFPTHALYQDSAGTTPVTALGQPVGLVLDQSRGWLANLGPQLVTNGDFSNGTTGWTAINNAVISAPSGALIVANSPTLSNIGGAVQAITTVVGASYRATVAFVRGTSSAVYLQAGTTSGGFENGFATSAAANGTLQLIFRATATTTYISVYNGESTVNLFNTFDNISVREVPGVHAIQPTSASRPLLDGRVNLLTYSEQFNNAAWAKSNVTVSANASTAPDGATTADRLAETTATGTHLVTQSATFVLGVSYAATVYLKAAERNFGYISVTGGAASLAVAVNLTTGALSSVVDTFGNYSGISISATDAGNGWWRVALIATRAAGGSDSGTFTVGVSDALTPNKSYAGNSANGILVWGADLRLAADAAYPYQRVVTATDYADVGVPRSFLFDGFDDSFYTASNLDMTATNKVTVIAGVSKLNTAVGCLAELSADPAVNPGTWNVYANGLVNNDYFFSSSGSGQRFGYIAPYAAPISNVLTMQNDLAGATDTQRVSARINGTSVLLTYGGSWGTAANYGSYPLYIGRRNNASNPLNGKVYQLIVRGALTDAATLVQAERFVAQRTGITL